MVVRKHISIEKKYVDKIKPLLEKYEGNFSAAIREIIDIAVEGRMALTHSDHVILFDSPTANFLLSKTNGIIPEKEILSKIADPLLFHSLSNTLEYFNIKFKELGWGITFSVTCDNDTTPTIAALTITGENDQLIDLSAKLFSLYLAAVKHLGIESVYRRSKSIELKYKVRGSEETAFDDIDKYLGQMQELYSEIEKRPDFWRGIVRKYRDSSYKTVAIHKNTFEDLLAKKTPIGEIGIELIAKRPIKNIPHREFLYILKEVYETSCVADNFDIEGDTIKVFHSYGNPRAVETLRNILLNQLKANGHTYTAESTRNLIIFRHMPEIGIKISELIANMKNSNSNFDREIIAFLRFCSSLKGQPDVSRSIRVLGYMMSKQIFTEYEKEHNIHIWNMKNFQNAFSALDSKIGRVSEWKLVNNKTICYIVKKCNLAQISGEFNIDLCQLSRGFFKGAIEYVFKDSVEVKVIKQLTHGDNVCEVHIQVQDPPI
ncbi:MAG: hypothetical protein OIN83_00815 [Candidatus Methanoperedens sp.]|nr:hypothetical protein [Candidatus Methanoperedens sp.]